MKPFMSPTFNLAPKIVIRRASPGRSIIEPRILYLIIRRGQSNFSIVFIFVSFEENAIVVLFRLDSSVLTAACIAGSAAVCRVGLRGCESASFLDRQTDRKTHIFSTVEPSPLTPYRTTISWPIGDLSSSIPFGHDISGCV